MIDMDEAMAVAQESLVKAAIKLDLTRIKPFLQEHIDTNFRSLAYWKIKGAIIDHCRRSTKYGRGAVRQSYQTVPFTAATAELFEAPPVEMSLEMKMAIERLTERERAIIYATIIGLSGLEIAQQLQISQARVSQILVSARKKLGAELGIAA